MNSATQRPVAPASDLPLPLDSAAISDLQWIAFIDEVRRRLEKDSRFTLLRSVMVELFHFDRPFFAALRERARHEFLPFAFTGEHCHPNGDPIRIVFSRRES